MSGNFSTGGLGGGTGANGVCTWAGFPVGPLSVATTLSVIAATTGTSDDSIPYTLTATVGATVTTLLSDSTTSATGTYTLAIASGVDLSTISVTATVLGTDDGDFDSIVPLRQSASVQIYEIYIQ